MRNTIKLSNVSAAHYSDSEDNSTPETIVIINCVLNAPLMLISILGNALVLAAIIRTPSIRSTSIIVLCSLAVSDLLVGFLVQPIYVAQEVTKEPLLRNLADMIGYFLCEGLSFDNNSHHRGSISGPSLSHEICYSSN